MNLPVEQMKLCQTCEVTKRRSEFFSDSTTFDGLKPFCIICARGFEEGCYERDPAKRRACNHRLALQERVPEMGREA